MDHWLPFVELAGSRSKRDATRLPIPAVYAAIKGWNLPR